MRGTLPTTGPEQEAAPQATGTGGRERSGAAATGVVASSAAATGVAAAGGGDSGGGWAAATRRPRGTLGPSGPRRPDRSGQHRSLPAESNPCGGLRPSDQYLRPSTAFCQMVRAAEQRAETLYFASRPVVLGLQGRPLSNPPPSAAGTYGRNCWAILITWPCSTVIQNGAVPLFGSSWRASQGHRDVLGRAASETGRRAHSPSWARRLHGQGPQPGVHVADVVVVGGGDSSPSSAAALVAASPVKNWMRSDVIVGRSGSTVLR